MATVKWVKAFSGSDGTRKGPSYWAAVSMTSELKSRGYAAKLTTKAEKETWSTTYHHTVWRSKDKIR
jgi:hypothetical protein